MVSKALIDDAIDAACVDERRRIARWLMDRAGKMRSVKAARALETAAADLLATDKAKPGNVPPSETLRRTER
jgi:plasmid stabilization system protein ParE